MKPLDNRQKEKPGFDRNALVHCLTDRQILGQEATWLNDVKNIKAHGALEDLLLRAREQLPFASSEESAEYRHLYFLYHAREAGLAFHYETACIALLHVVSLEEIRERRVLLNLIATLEEIT